MYRQGDILIVAVNDIPEDAKEVRRDNGRAILAYGEVTGHAHAFKDPDVVTFRDPKLNELFFKVVGSHVGPIEAELVEINHEKGFFLAKTALRESPIKFDMNKALFKDGIVETEPFSLLDHDEHYPHAYVAGKYKVVRQREYTPQEIKYVAD